MANEERKIRYGIKGKLISAIAMLLVAVIMTVSSTYAWFTLSTAPEVTGISTAVGANGALEMVLLSKNADGTWSYTNASDIYGDKNTTWGNLVDLSNGYGTELITLYPSALNTTLSGRVNMDSPLNFPQYGPDGRVEDVNGTTMLSGGFKNNHQFLLNEDYGFRAVGTTSGLSEREIALRTATSNINIYKTQAQDKAEASLTTHGSTLADMAIQKVMRDAPTFGDAHYAAVEGMIDGLGEALACLDEAYQQAVLAWAASSLTSADNTVYNAVKTIVEDDANYATIDLVIAAVEANFDAWEDIIAAAGLTNEGARIELEIPSWITGTALQQYYSMLEDVQEADDTLTNTVPSQETIGSEVRNTYTYAQMSAALQPLVNMSVLKVNDIAMNAEGAKDQIMASALAERAVWVSMTTGSGVYADVA
ncbi:MAG: hypothetical protein IJD10_01700, partial [Clostridia bacterium]|nr:hypothetical protein [Clostridia bacterium]